MEVFNCLKYLDTKKVKFQRKFQSTFFSWVLFINWKASKPRRSGTEGIILKAWPHIARGHIHPDQDAGLGHPGDTLATSLGRSCCPPPQDLCRQGEDFYQAFSF